MSILARGLEHGRFVWGGASALLAALALLFAPAARADAGWSFDPPSWDFGVVVPGTGPTPPETFTLTNTGDVELSISAIFMGGSEGARFERTRNTCGTLSPAESCEVDVTFDPSSAGPKQGQLSFASQGGVAPPATVQLSGTGAGPVVSVAPSSQVFDPLALGAGPSPPRTITVVNEGQLDLTISSIELHSNQTYNYPAWAEQFELAGGTCAVGVPLAPGSSCAVEVAFSPTAPGYLSTQLRIASNAPGSPHVAALEGAGIAPPVRFVAPPVLLAPRAALVRRPSRRTAKRHADFWLRGSSTAGRFACKLDNQQGFRFCESPVRYRRLRRGRHRFAVRALDANGRWGRPTVFRWRIVRPGGGR